jgi:hypothetical protein
MAVTAVFEWLVDLKLIVSKYTTTNIVFSTLFLEGKLDNKRLMKFVVDNF